MTNQFNDLKNADVVLVMGGNPAENHPISMKWILRAKKERGAKLVVVDPNLQELHQKQIYMFLFVQELI
jgi:formate dehydrogenase alpha subunit (EC 1.2.1.2)